MLLDVYNMSSKKKCFFWKYAETEWNSRFMNFIKSHKDKHWCWNLISMNPNITMEMINNNPDKPWDWICISMKDFSKDKADFLELKCREYMAIYKIKVEWKQCYYSPYTKIGKKRLERSYDKLFE